ncbi:MAG: SMP-30/gluconolactonase/LRE family protein [Cytophagales bacterium]|jgi:gluconolactonase|nr:SMP-30/gluconolactonase/LRE family protein [Cytophagales bacterium]MCA6366385.1 SMP-30/gluconolactonase/LRE family protein [Cytophagales bacterium]MCA6371184.1 SMP-30/gluconolactonase/LRE family protein [Cytophagales bacterium]MCA6374691.1 SMP-30/gluconolactonase/LRE family protein [Cytophagales bacterium]MCA6384560.1 SMP-30/gluconolactonase/LRE family protein [Cytophagales bacterium]
MKIFYTSLLAVLLVHCSPKKEAQQTSLTVSLERLSPLLDSVISNEVTISVIAQGFEWSEGPLWLDDKQMLLFSDVPANTIYQWTEKEGAKVYLKPSGYTAAIPNPKAQGSNGLTLDQEGHLIICQHGDRRIAMMNSPTDQPKAEFTTIAYELHGKRFNSPNDVVVNNFDYYFTDPPYGLINQMEDSSKEIPFQGVYQYTSNKKTLILIDTLTRPNGLAFSPDNKKLFIANSDPEKAIWYEYSLNPLMQIVSGKILYDATSNTKTEKGLPDGLKVDAHGNIFATGPGGIWIFSGSGELLGKIKVEEATSNCALTPDGKTLFVTNDMQVLKIKLRN